ncbi:hypothetical protein F511_45063 [Dorcoceras hygrometricum]|uniref:Uncharacterized protein n=1 Tax=Dorcoceras hygrometricum TaxID=472368 RepID=A0A2Z6ZWZ1_9LAMI|nr:hypothetical protein F511_45063 [Dorcoceras hygrometricum]
MRKLRATIGHRAPSVRPVDAAAAPSVAHRREACATSAQDEQQGGAIEWQAVGQRAQRLAQTTSPPAVTRVAALDQVRDQAHSGARSGARCIAYDARRARKLRPPFTRQAHGQRASSARDGARRGAAACGGAGRSMCDDISVVLI